ncbi:MAG: glycosyltransferase family 2 protein [Robiginitomaculum sp.]|nr:glycosyltransferase family 2 protein [Robiginitomaculum sp.]
MKDRGVLRLGRIKGDGYGVQPRLRQHRSRVAQIHVLGRKAAALAAGSLCHKDPLASAVLGISKAQKAALAGALFLVVGLTWVAPVATTLVLHHVLWAFFAVSIAFRAFLLVLSSPPTTRTALPEDQDLPLYTLLIPLYHEAEVLDDLCKAIEALNYPSSKLDIKLLLEADDKNTIHAVRDHPLGSSWEILIVPPIGPQTKPKALNAGFARARGELVTIYDAEDRPHPDQLRHAVRAFAEDMAGNLGCVQAPLGYYNADQNWLTRQFALEYAAHFQVLVPAMACLGLPFPLGGTSNHFRASALRAVGAWDPYNVTEDADLGYRLGANGWRLGTITPPTREEATAQLGPWQRQRSRWLKGYIQTIGVHMRRPAMHNALPGALSMMITLGTAVFAALGHALFSMLMLGVLFLAPWTGTLLAPIDYGLALAGPLVGMAMLAMGAKRASLTYSLLDLLGATLYWPLHSWAMARAILDLVRRPFYWEKTRHGLCPKTPDVDFGA